MKRCIEIYKLIFNALSFHGVSGHDFQFCLVSGNYLNFLGNIVYFLPVNDVNVIFPCAK